jgi:glutamyl/glutaminyl-tRNA synthetase
LIQSLVQVLESITPSDWKETILNQHIQNLCTSKDELSIKKIYEPARYLLTGVNVGAPVPLIMETLGKQRTLERLQGSSSSSSH